MFTPKMITTIIINIPSMSFFFQAEDGIRDTSVTGVQTCALPIYAAERTAVDLRRRCTAAGSSSCRSSREKNATPDGRAAECRSHPDRARCAAAESRALPETDPLKAEIGRASCRERAKADETHDSE